jgi:5-formyltetrahydrofolate cyclo-ligase
VSFDDQKRVLRRELKGHASRLGLDDRASLGAQASGQLLETRWFRSATSVLVYAALRDEIDLSLALASLTEKRVALPRYDKDKRVYCAALVPGSLRDLPLGQFGIPEPPPDAETIPLNALDVVLVPGVAFDRAGRRLGRGLGFYDRLLAEVPGIKCGVAYDWQIVPELPAEPHDISVDFIVTPTQSFATGTRVDLT